MIAVNLIDGETDRDGLLIMRLRFGRRARLAGFCLGFETTARVGFGLRQQIAQSAGFDDLARRTGT